MGSRMLSTLQRATSDLPVVRTLKRRLRASVTACGLVYRLMIRHRREAPRNYEEA